MRKGFIKELNALIADFQKAGADYESHIGQGVSLESKCGEILRSAIPNKLKEVFSTNNYRIKGSIGTGRVSKCPWVAVMNKKETESTQSGIYLVFLFSKDLKTVYLSLAQGVTDLKIAEIKSRRDELRSKLQLESELLRHFNEQLIDGDAYKASAIYSNEWKYNDNNYCEKLLVAFSNAYEKYMTMKEGKTVIESPKEPTKKEKGSNEGFSIRETIKLIKQTGLVYSDSLIKRFAFSLMSKRFLILSGLAGSGKTQLALAFASALVKSKEKQMCVVSVGADWTNREPLLGFPNALQAGKYVKPESGVLDLLIEANKPENADKPFFLILDEMNMSYVERYFADFLSAMESKEPISLWNPDEAKGENNEVDRVPQKVALPKNLFIIGTINVDETTYMFSPKVLDRANVIEFKIAEAEMAEFLKDMKEIDRESINGKAADMGADFVEKACRKDLEKDEKAISTLQGFFNELKSVNAEFGYRSATEIFRFICQAKSNDDATPKLTDAEILDAAIVQKLLPKLHGSRKKLEPVLRRLWKLCFTGAGKDLNIAQEHVEKAQFKESADKIRRMYESATANGFTSFAEA
jgi:5-methylcytosine-specific restriction protein B